MMPKEFDNKAIDTKALACEQREDVEELRRDFQAQIDDLTARFERLERLGEEEEENMVTIEKLAIESGLNARTVRNRITKARKIPGKLKWEKQGGTILIDFAEGLRIARAVGQPVREMDGRGRPRTMLGLEEEEALVMKDRRKKR